MDEIEDEFDDATLKKLNDEIEVKFNLKCFLLGHLWINGNAENDWNWCDRCFKEGWIE